jgi:hypothetical protein
MREVRTERAAGGSFYRKASKRACCFVCIHVQTHRIGTGLGAFDRGGTTEFESFDLILASVDGRADPL